MNNYIAPRIDKLAHKKLNTYHIVFKTKDTNHMSKGENFTGIDVEHALARFKNKYYIDDNNIVFISVYNLDALADIRGGEIKQISTNLEREIDDTSDVDKEQL